VEDFDKIWRRAAKRKGGDEALEALMPSTKSARSLKRLGDDRYLSQMTKCVFSAGFVWAVVENKWDGFEAVFGGFDPVKVARKTEKQMEKIASDPRIIRNRTKVWSVRDNARFVVEAAAEHGSFAKLIANWPADDVIGLYERLKRDGSRLGGASAGWFLRGVGKDVYMLTPDVIQALIRAGIVAKRPTSKRDRLAVQQAFDVWREQSGRSNAEISRTLSCSVPSPRR
jgi:3-methyladenine DNA glycosylase Tag